ncbi:GvpL/GvpF family gas vesicle protein [Acrocarpospora catenulata]|uniref:GvpL/GvpF family gas vesicle protein n=1 Tax=Acrocarpospora catenulata TaxID=2836182 RepID=UPI001BDA8813|nr:GvpL/GvpF family gas vesicle protein [Acrocarpospora catenulata]
MITVTDTGTYLYAVTRDTPPPCPEGLLGVAGTRVRTIANAGLLAYVSTVPLEQFGAEPLRKSMEDLDWLGETAGAHHHVVEVVAEHLPTAPVRLVTVYSGDEQIRDLLSRRHDDFMEVLTRIADREEWGVKAYVDLTAPSPATAPGPPGSGGPGTAYLRRRQTSLRGREEAWRQAAARAEQIHDTLSSFAVASRRHRAQDPQLSGRKELMILNGAYLVERDRREEFARVVEELRGQGVDVELTGPWAPYSFTDLADSRPEVLGDA